MRLDKFLSTIGALSRRESSDAIRHKKITVNGEAVDAKIENGLLTLAVEAGETKIALDVEEPVVEDPTQPTETEPSEPAQTDPTVAPTEPAPVEDGNDATLWIIIGVIVVLLAAAATFIVLFLKKCKAAN